jgi:hypothetical protein
MLVALEIEIVETSSQPVPAYHIRGLGADDMRGGAHPYTAVADWTIDQSHFEHDRCAGLDSPRRKEINATRADVLGHQANGQSFRPVRNLNQPERET